MSTLQIRKLESGVFKHVDSIDGEFFLGRFSFKQELDKSFLVEAYGAKRREYDVLEISVFDYLGTAELFTNWTDLENRLTDLGYTGIETNGIIPTASSYISSDADNALQLGTDNKLFVPESAGDFLSNDPTTYSPATLPLSGTEVALLNDGTNWVKITWNNIKAQLASVFQYKLTAGTNITIDNTDPLAPVISAIGGGTPPAEKLSKLINNNLDFNLSDFDVSGSATYTIDGGKLKASGGGSFAFNSTALHKSKTNVENFTAELDWSLANARTTQTYGLGFVLRSVAQFYKYGYNVLYDASIGGSTSGKLLIYNTVNGGIIHTSTVVVPMALNDKMRYTIHRNKNNYIFMLENLTQNKRTSFYLKSPVSINFPLTTVVNNLCRFGVAKQTTINVDYLVERLVVKRELNKDLDFLFLGDSITFGYEAGDDIRNRFSELIFSNTKSTKTFAVYAQPGNASVDYTGLINEILELNPKNLVINIGMNDAQNDVLTAVFLANINTLLAGLISSDINVIFSLIKPYDAKSANITAYNEAIETNFGTTYQVIDTFRPLIKASNSSLHPTNEEHNHIAQLLQIGLSELL